MWRFAFVLVALVLAAALGAEPASAACPFCADSITLQTPDGAAWLSGKPVTVVVSTHRAVSDVAFPASGLVVVMRTDGDRTKCLEVPLKLVSTTGDGAVYAGIFYPFRAAAYDGKLRIADETSDISFDVNRIVAGSRPVSDALPVGSVEEPDAFTVPLPNGTGAIALAGVSLAFWAAVAFALQRRRAAPAVV